MSHFHVRRSSLSRLALLLTGAILLATACSRDMVAPDAPPDTPPDSQPVDSMHTLGLVEVTISGIGTQSMLTSAQSVAPAALRQAQPGLSLSVSPVSGGDGTIQLEPVATGSFTDGERGAGGVRYLYATFRVRNAQSDGTAYATARTNLTFLGVASASTLSTTAIKSMKRFDGSDAEASIAADFIPTGGVSRNAATGTMEPNGADVLQVITEAEAGAVSAPASVTTVFPYGFVVRNPSASDGRTLPANPAAGQLDGVVTFAYKVPLQPTATEDPFTVTALFLAVDDGETRITESVEEQGTGSVQAGADALGGAAGVTLLGSSTTTVSGHGMQRICRVRTAGNDPLDPAATLVDAGSSCTSGTVSIPSHVRVVDVDASPGGDGKSWSTAFNKLQDAIVCVAEDVGEGEACHGVDELWVAEGNYYPDEGDGITENDATVPFRPVDGVAIYGGFAGWEYNRNQRNWETHVTVLDGDIDQDGTDAGNSFAVVSMSVWGGGQITRATVLDGFTVRHGVGVSTAPIVCLADGAGSECSPELDNLIVTENHGVQTGAMLLRAANGGVAKPLFQDVMFGENTAVQTSGALFIIAQSGGNVAPIFNRVTFDGNVARSAGQGGALFARALGGTVDARFTHSTFRNNVAVATSGGGGGAVHLEDGGTLRFTDSEFWNNTVRVSPTGALSGLGGAISTSAGLIELTDVTLANNGAAAAGNISAGGGSLTFNNTIIWGNSNPGSLGGSIVTANSSLIEGGCPSGATCTGVIGADPQFLDMANGDLRLGGSSPAVDAGNNVFVAPDTFDQDGDGNTSEILPFDLAGRPRILDWGGDDAFPVVDMGAYERQP
jgi:hypothetical protein